MNNSKLEKNTRNNIDEQMELLLLNNYDKLYWVYSIIENSKSHLKLQCEKNILTCYPNQFNNLKWLDNAPDINIIDLIELRKWNIKFLKKSKESINISNLKLTLLSNWVFETIKWENNKWETNEHLYSNVRDGWNIDNFLRTPIWWRAYWNDINKSLTTEHIEETPFIWYDDLWNISLATVSTDDEAIEILEKSINNYIKNKILKPWDNQYDQVKKIFDRNFRPLKYEDLEDILKSIIKEKRYFKYNFNKVEIENENYKEVIIWTNKEKLLVHNDNSNNTFECMKIIEITWFEEWFRPLNNRPSKLFLESNIQYPKFSRISSIKEKCYVEVVNFLKDKVKKIFEVTQ